jgi:hypothetical protein
MVTHMNHPSRDCKVPNQGLSGRTAQMSQAQQASQQDCWVNELISFKPL